VSTVLLVEDDTRLRLALRATFRTASFSVLETPTGEDALALVANEHPDLVILDLRLPGLSGLETLRHLRSFSRVPVIALTVLDALADKLAVLGAGADDYVVKPFETEELVARAQTQIRRSLSQPYDESTILVGELEIDLVRRTVTWSGERISMTPTELRLLEALLANRGRLVTREELIRLVWRDGTPSNYSPLRIAMLNLRRKLHDDAANPRLIFTEPGLGYRWVAESD
jgi:two-component system KDP operon response regulator KdpE